MMRAALIGLAGLAGLIALGALWVRCAPSDPARWHVDPLHDRPPRTPNFATLPLEESPLFDVPPATLAAALDRVALAEPRTTVLTREGDMVTYVQRSAVMGFPDYITARIIDLCGSRSLLALRSRSRFGYSDMGVNAARITRWMEALRMVAPVAQESATGEEAAPRAPKMSAPPPASAVFRRAEQPWRAPRSGEGARPAWPVDFGQALRNGARSAE